MYVAVIGAGAAGLVTARELQRAGHEVSVFEQADCIGGIWVYTPQVEADPLGQSGAQVHSSLYASLRTNLPRDLMAFSDFSFDSHGGGEDAWPRFPGHALVRTYLERFAERFHLAALMHLQTTVTSVAPDSSGGWQLRTRDATGEKLHRFDAVAVCSGHFSAPRVPELAGASKFPGRQLHSHNYRLPSPFAKRRIAVLGTAASGVDICREIAAVATGVYWCGELFDTLPDASRDNGNARCLPAIEALQADGCLRLRGGGVTDPVDDLIYCTGYHYRYPFLAQPLITVDDNWVQPLYRDLLHMRHPTLAFIGIPFRVVPFPLFEMQARWFARLVSGDFSLPALEARRKHTASAIAGLRAAGVKQRHFHQQMINCTPYLDALADECGVARTAPSLGELAEVLQAELARHRGDVRDRPLPHFGPTVVPPESISTA